MKKIVKQSFGANASPEGLVTRRRMLGQLAVVPLGVLASAPSAQASSDLKENFLGMIQAWNDHDSKKIASFFVDDCTYADIALNVVHRGKKELVAFADEAFSGFPDFALLIKSCVAGRDSVAAEWDMIMTWKGPYPGLGDRPDGTTYRMKGASVSHFNPAGKIVSNTDYWNLDEMMRQMKKS